MPHKRNLVTLEVARAKANLIQGFLTSAISTYSSLPYGYNLELQELNKVFMETVKTSIDTLRIVGDFIKRLEICPETLDSLVTNTTCWSAEFVEYVSIESKKPTRQVYFEIGELIKEGRVVNELNIDVKKLALAKPVAVKLKEAMSEYEGFIREDEETLSKLIKNLSECGNKLLKLHS
jgi:argininosuccinate lyase